MQQLYKGFIETKGKAAVEKFKGKTTFKTYQEVKDLDGFGGVLADDTILIDIDDSEQSEIMMDIVEDVSDIKGQTLPVQEHQDSKEQNPCTTCNRADSRHKMRFTHFI